MDRSTKPNGYESPHLTVLGSVHGLTLMPGNKDYGVSDGWTFQGIPVTTTS